MHRHPHQRPPHERRRARVWTASGDFVSVTVLAQQFDFDGARLAKAIGATFRRRKTPLPATQPLAFSDEFARDTAKRTQWTAFVRRLGLDDAPGDLAEVVGIVRVFLKPVIGALVAEKSFERHWSASGNWKRSSHAQRDELPRHGSGVW